MRSRIYFQVILKDEQDWRWVDNGWSWVMGVQGVIRLFSLALFMFDVLHNEKLLKNYMLVTPKYLSQTQSLSRSTDPCIHLPT